MGKPRQRASSVDPSQRLRPVDMGSTPPWYLPAYIHGESALRSTQARRSLPSSPVQLLPKYEGGQDVSYVDSQGESLIIPSQQLSPAVDKGMLPRVSPNEFSRTRKNPTPMQDSEADDAVYMLNVDPDSWCGTLPSEQDPRVQAEVLPETELFLKRIQRAREIEAQDEHGAFFRLSGNGSKPVPAVTCPLLRYSDIWAKDILLRTITRQIKRRLQSGAMLRLDSPRGANTDLACEHPYCSGLKNAVTPGLYFLTLVSSDGTKHGSTFCLLCLEALWSGSGLIGELPAPNVSTDSAQQPEVKEIVFDSSLNLDGTSDGIKTFTSNINLITTSSASASAYSRTARWNRNFESADSLASSNTDYAAQGSVHDHPHVYEQTEIQEIIYTETSCKLALDKQQIGAAVGLDCTVQADRVADIGQKRRSLRLRPIESSNHSIRALKAESPTAAVHKKPGSYVQPRPLEVLDAFECEITRTEERLNTMYKQRDRIETRLKLGQSVQIKHPKGTVKVNKRFVRMDVFGIVHTDLLDDHVKHCRKQSVKETPVSVTACAVTPSASAQKRHSTQQQQDGNAQEFWCSCRGREDDCEKMLCDNGLCLISWYNVDRVDLSQQTEEDDTWLCPLSMSQLGGARLTLERSINKDAAETLCPSPWYRFAHGVLERYFSSNIRLNLDRSHAPTARTTWPCQMDGISDSSGSLNCPSEGSPSSRSSYAIPQTLLASKHAPASLQPSPSQQHKTSSKFDPDFVLDKSHSPTPSPTSVTSEGNWLQPVTRFQHLAHFIIPGDTLNDAEKAALGLWRAASEGQIRWDEFRARYRRTMEELRLLGLADNVDGEEVSGSETVSPATDTNEEEDLVDDYVTDDGVLKCKKETANHYKDSDEDFEERERELRDWELMAGIHKSRCRGKDLTEVLALVNSGPRE